MTDLRLGLIGMGVGIMDTNWEEHKRHFGMSSLLEQRYGHYWFLDGSFRKDLIHQNISMQVTSIRNIFTEQPLMWIDHESS